LYDLYTVTGLVIQLRLSTTNNAKRVVLELLRLVL